MNISVLKVGLLSVALFAMPVSAEIIDNSTYTTDTVGGLDWLDVSSTTGLSVDYISTQFGIGGDYEGWRYATGIEFNILINNYTGSTYHIKDYTRHYYDEGVVDGLVELLGDTSGTAQLYTYGRIADFHDFDGRVWLSLIAVSNNSTQAHSAYGYTNSTGINVGHYLVRDYDNDIDNDGTTDDVDNCLDDPNQNQDDIDLDGIGDVCDPDNDNDGVYDVIDQCSSTPINSYVDNAGCPIDLDATYQSGYDAGYQVGYNVGYTDGSVLPPVEEVTVCHRPGSKNQKTMVISPEGLVGHLRHGDSDGACI